MQKILVATHNLGKFKELMEVLENLPFKFVSLNDEKIIEDVEETGSTYAENAIIKAEFFGKKTGLPTIADDSGIHVEALAGELGVKTRRWGAGAKATDQEWLDYFLKRMSAEKSRRAEFVTTIAFWRPNEKILTFEGQCVGQILDKPQCDIEPGIPLSAVFLPDGKDKVYSQMNKTEKNEISHRGKAIKKCYEYLLKHFLNRNNQSITQKDDEDLDELLNLYTSEKDIHSALRQKESDDLIEVGVLVKDYPAPQRELDLHGFSVPESLFEMERFIRIAIDHKIRTVRIITGRGLHSKNMTSVLPEEIEKKLAELRKERKLLAFRREKTGGSFAVYLIS